MRVWWQTPRRPATTSGKASPQSQSATPSSGTAWAKASCKASNWPVRTCANVEVEFATRIGGERVSRLVSADPPLVVPDSGLVTVSPHAGQEFGDGQIRLDGCRYKIDYADDLAHVLGHGFGGLSYREG